MKLHRPTALNSALRTLTMQREGLSQLESALAAAGPESLGAAFASSPNSQTFAFMIFVTLLHPVALHLDKACRSLDDYSGTHSPKQRLVTPILQQHQHLKLPIRFQRTSPITSSGKI